MHKKDWNEKLMEVLLNESDDAFQFADLSGKLLYANRRAAENIGVELLDGRDLYVWHFEENFKGPDDWSEHVEHLRSEKLSRVRGKHRHQVTGEVRNVEVLARIVEVDGQEFVVASVRNIDLQIQEEHEKHAIMDMLEKTSELAVVGGWRLDLVTEEVSWTDQVYGIYNIERGTLIKLRTVYDSLEKESIERLKVAVDLCLEDGTTWDLELQIREAETGRLKWIRSQGNREVRDGKPSALYGIVQDVDRLKRLESENLRKQSILSALSHSIERLLQEKDFRKTLSASFSALGKATGVDRVYLFKANKSGTNVSSYSQVVEWNSGHSEPQIDNPELQGIPTDSMGDAHQVLIQGESWERIVRQIESTQAREILSSQKIKSILLLPVFVDVDNYYGFVGFDDCEEERSWSDDERSVLHSFCNSMGNAIRRQQNERVLEQQNKDLGRLMNVTASQNERLLNFAYITSHNIRSHAGNIQGLLKLHANESTQEERDLYFSLLNESATKLVSTINGLNEIVSKNITKELNLSKVSLKEAFEDALIAVNNEMRRLEVRLENGLRTEDQVAVFPAYLDSIILNLLTNAIKYRSPSRDLLIKVECHEAKGEYVELVFSDNGSGIDLDQYGRELFGMYKTFHNHPESSGLGLYLTKMQIEAMGGSIRAESEINRGTTFYVTLKRWETN